jgi:hypothetical protein
VSSGEAALSLLRYSFFGFGSDDDLDRSPKIPFKEDYKAVITANKPYLQENKISKEYKGFRSFISEKTMHTNLAKIEKQERKDLKIKTETGHSFREEYVLHFMWHGIRSL